MFLYLNMSCICKWNNVKSRVFDIPTGTKQGGILSPDFFSLYIDDLASLLKASGFGCHVINICIACIFFADDIVLLSPSIHGLRELINICVSYCGTFCLDFNVKKSKIMVIGEKLSVGEFSELTLNNVSLAYVTEFKYLGVTLVAGKNISFSATPDIRSFYRASNSILSSGTITNENVLMKLLYTNCVPILTYSCAVKEYSASGMSSANTAINNCIKKIFSFARFESVRHLRESYHRKSIYEIFSLANSKFIKSSLSSSNTIIRHIANCLTIA